MQWNMMLGAMVAVGLLGTAEVRAQETAAENTAAAASAQSEGSQPPAYGTYVNGPSMPDADGVPVAEPNPMSDFEERARAFDGTMVPMPLVDDPRAQGSASGQTN